MIRKKEYEQARSWIDGHPNIDIDFRESHDYSPTALEFVTGDGDISMIRFLIGKGANVDLQDKKGITPLIFAALEHQTGSIRELILHGASIDMTIFPDQEDGGGTALHWSFQCLNSGCEPTARLLLDAGIDHTIRASDGTTAREQAAGLRESIPSLAAQYGPAWDGVVEAIDAVERHFLISIGRRTFTGEPIPVVSEKNGRIRALRLPEEDAAVILHVIDRLAGLKFDPFCELMTLLG